MNKKIESYRKKIEKFNADLEAYYRVDDSRQLPLIDCTVTGYERVEPYTVSEIENGILVDMGWQKVEITEVTEDGETYITGWDTGLDSVKECIAYDRRKLAKAWRVWRSENPDAELEKDEEV